MTQKIRINPLTRLSGFLEIQVTVEQNRVMDAKSSGLMYRGFEKMLRGRPPLDAIYFTERICGICSTAHAMASTLALEDALQVPVTQNGKFLRDFAHGCEFLQNHLRHFYQYSLPDFVRGPKLQPLYPVAHADYRLPEETNQRLADHYLESVQYSRHAHEMLAVLGGKAPHNHGIFVGGVTVNLDAAKLIKVKSLLAGIKEFVTTRMLDDVYTLAEYYPEYFENGRGYGNLMSFGLFDQYSEAELRYLEPKALIQNQILPFNRQEICENIYHSWYQAQEVCLEPYDPVPDEDLSKEQAYSWVKAPRYNGNPVEVGPLARLWLSGDYTHGISTMDRIIARVLEVVKIVGIMEEILARVEVGPAEQQPWEIPTEAKGVGLIDTTRGALGHWLSIQDQQLEHYDIITPTAWNLSPEDSYGLAGVVEKALLGTEIVDPAHPVEIGRIVRSFDPCISCATHVVSDRYPQMEIRIL